MSVFHCTECGDLVDADFDEGCEEAASGLGLICGTCVEDLRAEAEERDYLAKNPRELERDPEYFEPPLMRGLGQ